MTLLITVFAALFFTYKWYCDKDGKSCFGPLCLILWGASLMWTVDALFEFAELKEEYFNPAPADMLNDTFLGFTAVALALVIWVVILLVKDPKGRVKEALKGERSV
ncbi:MAG: hypothetical protein IKN14_04540 [Clostridiales bacterium]|nr:hypothetical protein [Clostridiales bacterium]